MHFVTVELFGAEFGGTGNFVKMTFFWKTISNFHFNAQNI